MTMAVVGILGHYRYNLTFIPLELAKVLICVQLYVGLVWIILKEESVTCNDQLPSRLDPSVYFIRNRKKWEQGYVLMSAFIFCPFYWDLSACITLIINYLIINFRLFLDSVKHCWFSSYLKYWTFSCHCPRF